MTGISSSTEYIREYIWSVCFFPECLIGSWCVVKQCAPKEENAVVLVQRSYMPLIGASTASPPPGKWLVNARPYFLTGM